MSVVVETEMLHCVLKVTNVIILSPNVSSWGHIPRRCSTLFLETLEAGNSIYSMASKHISCGDVQIWPYGLCTCTVRVWEYISCSGTFLRVSFIVSKL